jgi:hypothetical protein
MVPYETFFLGSFTAHAIKAKAVERHAIPSGITDLIVNGLRYTSSSRHLCNAFYSESDEVTETTMKMMRVNLKYQ